MVERNPRTEIRGNLVPTVRIILEHDNYYLLLRKGSASKAAGLREFPGGKIEGLVSDDTEKKSKSR